MAESPAPCRAVGPDFEPVYAWPHITPKIEWESLLYSLADTMPVDFDPDSFQHQLEKEEDRSVVWVPKSAMGTQEQGLDLFAWTDGIARALGRKELRYGSRGNKMFIGFSGQLSEAEERTCLEYKFFQRGKRGKTLSSVAVNEDGSQTLSYQGAGSARDKQRRFREAVHGVVPLLDGIVLCNAVVPMFPTEQTRYPSLFSGETDKPPETKSKSNPDQDK